MNWNEQAETIDPESRNLTMETALREHLENSRPELLAELGDQTPGYLAVMVRDAQSLEQNLRDQATPEETIRELVNDQLFSIPQE